MIKRRKLLIAFGASIAAMPLQPFAQQRDGKIARVAVLVPGISAMEDVMHKPFFEGMQAFGWLEGRNVTYDRAYAGNDHSRLPALAAELVARAPDVIYAPPAPAALAAQKATRAIPIVFAAVGDPVGLGLVQSLARPGGNVTGITNLATELGPKRVQLAQQMLPRLRRLGILADPSDLASRHDTQEIQDYARRSGLTVVIADVSRSDQVDAAIAVLVKARTEAIMTSTTAATNHRKAINDLAHRAKLPVMWHLSSGVEDDGLASYGPDVAARLKRAAYFVDRLLRGAKPADIPVEQPTKFELVINVKTAKALGIKIPQAILLRADKVIE